MNELETICIDDFTEFWRYRMGITISERSLAPCSSDFNFFTPSRSLPRMTS